MLRTIGDILSQVLVRANATTTAATGGLYTDTILASWVNDAHRYAAAQRKWPFTEGRASTTFTTSEEVPYFEGWKSDSIRILTIGDKNFQKINFGDYRKFREDQPDSDDRIYSDFAGILYVNPSADAGGTLVAYGQFTPAALDTTDLTALTVFSDREEEGNEAIVEEMLKYAKLREKKQDEAQLHHNRAVEILEGIWKRHGDEQYGYQGKGEGMWERVDVLRGATDDGLFKRDQFF